MDPVSISIVLSTIGWLAKPTFKKAVDEAWKQFIKTEGLDAQTDELIAELKNFKVPMETGESTDYLKQVKELVHEAKDLLDELDYFRMKKEVKEMNKAERGNIFTRFKSSDVPCSSATSTNLKELKFDKRGMSKRMKDLINKLKNACASSNTILQHQLLSSIAYSVQNVNNQAVQNERQTTSDIFEKIYGRDDQIKQIQELISHAEQHSTKVPVIAIVGNGGAGKTTLAKQVYNEPPVQFDLKIWICVSTDFDEMRITRHMLECCFGDGKRCDGENLDNLKSILKSKLKGKKVLLVLDYMWEIKNKSGWNSLLGSLNPSTGNMAGTVVLVTTRFLSIAKNVEAISPIISLDGLDESSFWSLFKSCVFGDDQYNVPYTLENIGRDIVKRLRGHPLAVKTVGGLLKDNRDALYWTEILENEQWKFQEGKDDIMPTLQLSYNYLPVHLKHCFAYCSLFPKDHYFKAEELVYMWMAQDFINTNVNKRVEDVGVDYLNDLVARAFFQKIFTEWDGKEVKYVIHDLMHDLAQSVSSDEFFVINRLNPIPDPPNSLRHLSCLLRVDYTIENHVQFQNLSSLLIFENEESLKDALNWDQANKVRLRLLILPYQRLISYNFSHFTHLRYLKINYCNLYRFGEEKAKFPVHICQLYNLQMLELKYPVFYCEEHEVPKEFNNLVNLRHFIADPNLHGKIVGVGKMKRLQELKRFVVREQIKGFEISQLSELKELTGSLQIVNLENVKCKEEEECVKLSEKEIVELELSWSWGREEENHNKITHKNKGGRGKWRPWLNKDDRECQIEQASPKEILQALRPNNKLRKLSIISYGGPHAPSWLVNHSIKYLEYIRLSNCEALEELPNFGQLMCLKELYLIGLDRVKAFGPQFHGCGPHEGFPSLKVMEVEEMVELETWVWIQGYKGFPSLERLTISDCPKLRQFSSFNPISVQEEDTKWFPKLQFLNISSCDQLQQVPPIMGTVLNEADIIVGFGSIRFLRYNKELYIYPIKVPEFFTFIFRSSMDTCSTLTLTSRNFLPLIWKYICMLHNLKTLQFRELPQICFMSPVEEEKHRTLYLHESVQELNIYRCGVTGHELSHLLAHLPAIRKLSIEECDEIDYVSLSLEVSVKVDETQKQSLHSLAYLEELYIGKCPNMVFINEEGFLGLTALKEVNIRDSDKLLHSIIQEEQSNFVLILIVRWSKLSSLNLRSFVALRELVLSYCEEMAIVEGRDSPACSEVIIRRCPQLAEMGSEIEPKFLLPMEKLKIDNIEFLSVNVNSFSMSLRSLIIVDGKWMEWTEEQENLLIKHLTALQEFTLSRCEFLDSLPSTLHLHPSLKELTLDGCRMMKYLPERGFPKSLQKFCLRKGSEELKSQCSQLEDFECSGSETDKDGNEVFVRKVPSLN